MQMQDMMGKYVLDRPKRFVSRATSQPVRSRHDKLHAAVRVFGATQFFLVGLLILPLSLGSIHDAYAAVSRTIGLATVASTLSAVIYRGWQSPKDGFTGYAYNPVVNASKVVGVILISFAVIAACRSLVGSVQSSPAPLTIWAVVSATVGAVLQFVPTPKTRLVVAGESCATTTLARKLRDRFDSHRIEIVEILDLRDARSMARLDEVIASGGADAVLVPAGTHDLLMRQLCSHLADTVVRVQVVFASNAECWSPLNGGAGHLADCMPLFDLLPPPMSGWRRLTKRAFDICFVLLTIPALLPLFVLAAVAIRLESLGPVLFRQWRFGLGSTPVLIYKFRTMRADLGDASGEARTVARDSRVTRVGRVLRRLSIDELPQLWNVLRGEMSLVGPRPHATHMRVEGVYYFEAVDFYRARHRMPPGITGWAQVNGSRGEVDTLQKAQHRLELDLWYVANWSPFLDVWIIIRTMLGGFVTFRAD